MTKAQLGPEALTAVALETLKSELLPALPPEHRYAGAMVANALEIALRGLVSAAGGTERRLLDSIYGNGEGSLEMLSHDIRVGRISEATHPRLRALLREHVRGELLIRNPRFLATRIGGGASINYP